LSEGDLSWGSPHPPNLLAHPPFVLLRDTEFRIQIKDASEIGKGWEAGKKIVKGLGLRCSDERIKHPNPNP
jgi:hypothetical protein